MRKIDLTNFQAATSETARQINRRIALNFIRRHTRCLAPIWQTIGLAAQHPVRHRRSANR